MIELLRTTTVSGIALAFALCATDSSAETPGPMPRSAGVRGPDSVVLVLEQARETGSIIRAEDSAGTTIARIVAEWNGENLVGSVYSSTDVTLSFTWRPIGRYLSFAEADTRLGAAQLGARALNWRMDPTSRLLLSAHARSVALVQSAIVDDLLGGRRREPRVPDEDYQDFDNPPGGGGPCNGHYMKYSFVWCYGQCGKDLFIADPQRAEYDDGYTTGEDMCGGYCQNDKWCWNP